MPQSQSLDTPISDDDLISKAVGNAARRLRIDQDRLNIFFESEAAAKGPDDPRLLFLRLYRSLDAIVGGDNAVATSWLHNHNLAFQTAPIEKIWSRDGLNAVVMYLDSRRAII